MEREMNAATSGEKPARYKIEKARRRFKEKNKLKMEDGKLKIVNGRTNCNRR
jgi:hypothetical protein